MSSTRMQRRFAWTVSRLLLGESVNGEIDRLEGPGRAMAEELAKTESLEQRKEFWERYLNGIGDKGCLGSPGIGIRTGWC